MKRVLTRGVRAVLPGRAVRGLENVYRRSRTNIIASLYGRPSSGLRVIAVTGTNGKTTTLCYLNEILKEAGRTTALFTTAVIEVNGKSQINDLNATVADTRRMQQFFRQAKKAKVDFVLLEVTSHALDQHKLTDVPIEMAIMTNLTQDHLDYHASMDEYAAAKSKLLSGEPKFIVLNRDDEWFDYFNEFQASAQKITYGTHKEAEAQIERVTLYRRGTEARLVIDHQSKLELATALPGRFNVYNLAAASAGAYLLGLDLNDIVEGAANLESVPGRFERPVQGLGFDVIVDYAHTPDALEKMLDAVRELTKGRVILVFGACGDRDKGKRPQMGEIASRLTDRIILTDEESYDETPQAIRDMIYAGIEQAGGTAKTTEVPDRRAAIEKALSIAKKGDTVLVTGMGHEQYRIEAGERIPWNDSEVIREIVASKRK